MLNISSRYQRFDSEEEIDNLPEKRKKKRRISICVIVTTIFLVTCVCGIGFFVFLITFLQKKNPIFSNPWWNGSNDVLTDNINKLSKKVCPFIDPNGLQKCGKSSLSGSNYLYELISFNTFDGTTGYPIVDLAKSIDVKITKHTDLLHLCIPHVFKDTNDFYDKWLNLELISSSTQWEWYNGMFHQDDIEKFVPMFTNLVGSQKRTQLVANQNLYVTESIQVDLKNIRLRDEFTNIVDNFLPEKYDKDSYRKFVEAFGTHTGINCDFGGIIEQELFLTQCEKEKDPSYVQNLCADIEKFADDPGTSPRGGSDNYQKYSKVYTSRVSGGNPLLSEKTQWKKRISTFHDDPVAVRCSFVPVSRFLKNEKKKANLQTYIKGYVKDKTAQRKKQFDDIRAKTTIPFVLYTPYLGGGGFQYSMLYGTLPTGKEGEVKLHIFYHINCNGEVPEYDKEKLLATSERLNNYGINLTLSDDNKHCWYQLNGDFFFNCRCKSDRSCSCYFSGFKDKSGKIVPSTREVCYPQYKKVLDINNAEYKNQGKIVSGCVPSFWDIEYWSEGVSKEKLPNTYGPVTAFIGCEMVNYDKGTTTCVCQV